MIHLCLIDKRCLFFLLFFCNYYTKRLDLIEKEVFVIDESPLNFFQKNSYSCYFVYLVQNTDISKSIFNTSP